MVESASERLTAPQPTIETSGPFTLMRLSGDPYEQGFEHGKLLAESGREGALAFVSRLIDLTLRNSPTAWASQPIRWYLDVAYARRLERRLPAETRAMLRGLADGSGFPYDKAVRAFTVPDVFPALVMLWQWATGVGLVSSTPPPPPYGCTSAIATGAATKDGKLYHARNFDYPALGYWDPTPVVMFVKPKAGDGHAYMSATSVGVPTGGITGVNDARISIAIHQHWAHKVDPDGVPVGIAAEQALRHASSIDDAVRILLDYPTAGAWTYILADGKRRDAAALEVAPGRHGLVRLGDSGVPDCLGYSNRFCSRELAGRELPLNNAYWNNCLFRYARANELLRRGRGAHTPATLASVLSDHGADSATDHEHVLGESVPMAITVASVVFDPEDAVMWMSCGPAVTSYRSFTPFSLHAQDVATDRDPIATSTPRPALRRAHELYSAAYRRSFEQHDTAGAAALLRQAIEVEPEGAELWQLLGMLALSQGAARDSVDHLRRALALGLPPARAAETRLALALALDLTPGGRREARELYDELRHDPLLPKHTRRFACRRRWLPFSRRDAGRLGVDLVFGALIT